MSNPQQMPRPLTAAQQLLSNADELLERIFVIEYECRTTLFDFYRHMLRVVNQQATHSGHLIIPPTVQESVQKLLANLDYDNLRKCYSQTIYRQNWEIIKDVEQTETALCQTLLQMQDAGPSRNMDDLDEKAAIAHKAFRLIHDFHVRQNNKALYTPKQQQMFPAEDRQMLSRMIFRLAFRTPDDMTLEESASLLFQALSSCHVQLTFGRFSPQYLNRLAAIQRLMNNDIPPMFIRVAHAIAHEARYQTVVQQAPDEKVPVTTTQQTPGATAQDDQNQLATQQATAHQVFSNVTHEAQNQTTVEQAPDQKVPVTTTQQTPGATAQGPQNQLAAQRATGHQVSSNVAYEARNRTAVQQAPDQKVPVSTIQQAHGAATQVPQSKTAVQEATVQQVHGAAAQSLQNQTAIQQTLVQQASKSLAQQVSSNPAQNSLNQPTAQQTSKTTEHPEPKTPQPTKRLQSVQPRSSVERKQSAQPSTPTTAVDTEHDTKPATLTTTTKAGTPDSKKRKANDINTEQPAINATTPDSKKRKADDEKSVSRALRPRTRS